MGDFEKLLLKRGALWISKLDPLSPRGLIKELDISGESVLYLFSINRFIFFRKIGSIVLG